MTRNSEATAACRGKNAEIFFLRAGAWLSGFSDCAFTRSIFLRLLGVVYFFAFVSLWIQIEGLIGANGILPVQSYMKAAANELSGLERWRQMPTFCWLSPSDASLFWQCLLGTALSVTLALGYAPLLVLPGLWLLWLSLTVAGQDFLAFQWDHLLLETGLIAVFYAPFAWRTNSPRPCSMLAVWLLRWLLFRLMFLSGMVKLLSGDPAWRDFTALLHHYQTQPLPTVVGWWAHHLPDRLHLIAAGVMFFIELVLPFLIFLGRRARIAAGAGFIVLQGGIALTGNYCYFNLLSAILCVPLVDDALFRRAGLLKAPGAAVAKVPEKLGLPRLAPLIAFSMVVLVVSGAELLASLRLARDLPRAAAALCRFTAPFRSINSYGLFAIMTQTRPEIIVEGSDDGREWRAYEFRHKPGELARRPGFVAPHQPRLDWQMWFAALGTYRQNGWFVNFCVRLLEGKPEVLRLLRVNPFGEKPPKYLRGSLYEYKFTSLAEYRETGRWWKREYRGIYLPAISLRERQEHQ